MSNKYYHTNIKGAHFLNNVAIPAEALITGEQEAKIADYFIHAVNVSFLLLSILDKLRGTPYEQRELKQTLNRFYPELEKVATKKLAELVDANHHPVLWKMLDEQEEFLKEVARFRSHQYPIMHAVFRMMREDEKAVLEALGINAVYEYVDQEINP